MTGRARALRSEDRVLRTSMRVSLAIALAALVLGLGTGTRVLVFDGVFVMVGAVMTWVSLRVSVVANSGPTRHYPFGREGLTPLMVLLQGVALLGALLYAAIDALIIIRDGGRPVAAGVVAAYSTVGVLVSFASARWIRGVRPTSDLIEAEAIQWRSGGIQSLVTVVGVMAAIVFARFGAGRVLDFVDPVLVLVSCAMVVPAGVGLLRHGVDELLLGGLEPEEAAEIAAAIDAVCARHGLVDPVVRAAKVGTRLQVEVLCLVADPAMTIAEEDRVRREVLAALADTPYEVWVTTELTTDPGLMA